MNNNENPFLNEVNDLTRQAYTNKSNSVPLNNKATLNRFETDIFLNSKEEFSNNNTRINNLNDEILELKEKLKIIPEKEETINQLLHQKEQLEKKLTDSNYRMNELETKLKQIQHTNDTLLVQCTDLETQNKILVEQSMEPKEVVLHDKDDEIQKDKEDIENEIKVDILQIKSILSNRLKSYHEKHIDGLIQSYQLNEKESITKDTMKRLLLEVIHI
tara:strand:+ start:281 stop:931 length:651 start_codon:yes stop_codon:yes gene_type:complete